MKSICRHGHVLKEVGVTKRGECKKCKNAAKRRAYARASARAETVRTVWSRWTCDEDSLLRALYPFGNIKEIARKLNKSVSAVEYRAQIKLKLRCNNSGSNYMTQGGFCRRGHSVPPSTGQCPTCREMHNASIRDNITRGYVGALTKCHAKDLPESFVDAYRQLLLVKRELRKETQ